MSSPADHGHPQRWIVLAVLASSLLFIAMDATIVNVALPSLATELEPSSTELLWIVDAYGLVLAGLLVAMAGLGDRIGRRRLLLAGLGMFALAAGLAALASSPLQLIAARAVLGVGGAMVMPSTLSVLRGVFLDDRERAVAIGVWSSVAAGGFALGPVVGGAILEVADWPWVFAVQLPVLALAFAAVVRWVPESRDPDPGPWDPAGVALSVVGMLALVWGIKEGAKHGLDEPAAPLALAAGAAALAAFVRRQARQAKPLVDVGLFRDRRFATAAVAVLSVFFGLSGLLLALTQYLQVVQDHGPLAAGARLLPLAIAAAVAAPLTDAVVRRVGARVVLGGGFAAVAAGLGALAGLDAESPYALVAASLVAMGAGAGVASTAASTVIMAAAPPERAGGAAAVQETAYELGGGLGVAVFGSLLGARYAAALDAPPALPAEAADAVREGLPGAVQIAGELGGSAGAGLLAAAEAAFLDGLGVTVVAGAAAMGLVAVATFAFVPREPRAAAAQASRSSNASKRA